MILLGMAHDPLIWYGTCSFNLVWHMATFKIILFSFGGGGGGGTLNERLNSEIKNLSKLLQNKYKWSKYLWLLIY